MYLFSLFCIDRQTRHCPERTSASDFKDIAFPMFCYSNVVFGLFIATRFWHKITFLPNLAKLFLVTLNENILTLHKKYHKFCIFSTSGNDGQAVAFGVHY